MSGAGKSTALNFFEDLDFETVDNLPLELINRTIKGSGNKNRFAFGIDIRTRDFNFENLKNKINNLLLNNTLIVKVFFIECDDDTLIRRYKETKRPHPLGKENTLSNSIKAEREYLLPLKKIANVLIDTSKLTPYELRRKIIKETGNTKNVKMHISLLSFGYKIGIPEESDLVVDVRFLRNPFYLQELKNLSGLNKEVKKYITCDPFYSTFINNLKYFIKPLIPKYEYEGKNYLTISIGCTGGQHRSVCVIEEIGNWLDLNGIKFDINHRDLIMNMNKHKVSS